MWISISTAKKTAIIGRLKMPKEAMMIRQGGFLCPVDEVDREVLTGLKVGNPYKVGIKDQSDRSLKHHRLFYGGLVKLAMEYYEPKTGYMSPAEKHGAKQFAKWLADGVPEQQKEALRNAYSDYIKSVEQSRSERIEAPPVTTESFVEYLKLSVNYYTLAQYPDGTIKREPKSINFQSMSQGDFDKFYKDCFSVIWRMIFSRHFESEQEAQNVIDQLVSMGG